MRPHEEAAPRSNKQRRLLHCIDSGNDPEIVADFNPAMLCSSPRGPRATLCLRAVHGGEHRGRRSRIQRLRSRLAPRVLVQVPPQYRARQQSRRREGLAETSAPEEFGAEYGWVAEIW